MTGHKIHGLKKYEGDADEIEEISQDFVTHLISQWYKIGQ